MKPENKIIQRPGGDSLQKPKYWKVGGLLADFVVSHHFAIYGLKSVTF